MTKNEQADNLNIGEQEDQTIYRLSVIVVDKTRTPNHQDFHVDLRMKREIAEEYQRLVMKRGFTANGERFFADQIETTNLYEVKNETNCRGCACDQAGPEDGSQQSGDCKKTRDQ